MEREELPVSESNEIKEPTLWKKIGEYGRIMALLATLSLPAAVLSGCQEKGEEEYGKIKIEQLEKDTNKNIKDIIDYVYKVGEPSLMGITRLPRENKEAPIFFNFDVKRWQSPKTGTSITIEYINGGKENFGSREVNWLASKDNLSSVTYLDKQGDGSVNRGVIRKGIVDKPEENDTLTFDNKKIFGSIEKVAKEAREKAQSSPENFVVFDVFHIDKDVYVRVVDFSNGESYILSGSGAVNFVVSIQEDFARQMNKVNSELKN